MNSKIQKELSELVQNNIITNDIAQNITSYYLNKQENKPNRLFTVFGVLGSLLVGLGVILILAHNWDHFSRATKTIFAFLPLIIGQIVSGYAIIKKRSATWREASGTFLFFAIGSSMALVAQIYNIPGDLSSYLLTWTVLSLPLIYLLRSNAVAILCVVFATYYAGEFGYSFSSNTKIPWLYLLLILAIIPYYIQLLKSRAEANITSVFNWLFPLSLTIILGAFVDKNDDLGFLMYLTMFGLFYNIGKIPFFNKQKLRRNGYLIIGSLGSVKMMLMASFDTSWYDLKQLGYTTPELYVALCLLVITIMLLAYSYMQKWIINFNPFQYVFIIFSALFFTGLIHTIASLIIVNFLILALGLITIKIGIDKFHFGVLNYGLLIITALVVCRFFDTDMSYVIRGLLFVTVGGGFFLTNYIMLKRQKIRERQSLKNQK